MVVLRQPEPFNSWPAFCKCGAPLKGRRAQCNACNYARQKFKKINNPEFFKKVLIRQIKNRAKTHGFEFNLTTDDLIFPDVCPILGIPVNKAGGSLTDSTPSVDRIDNSKGYIKGNIFITSYRGNTRKGDLSLEDIKRLYEYCKKNIEGFV